MMISVKVSVWPTVITDLLVLSSSVSREERWHALATWAPLAEANENCDVSPSLSVTVITDIFYRHGQGWAAEY